MGFFKKFLNKAAHAVKGDPEYIRHCTALEDAWDHMSKEYADDNARHKETLTSVRDLGGEGTQLTDNATALAASYESIIGKNEDYLATFAAFKTKLEEMKTKFKEMSNAEKAKEKADADVKSWEAKLKKAENTAASAAGPDKAAAEKTRDDAKDKLAAAVTAQEEATTELERVKADVANSNAHTFYSGVKDFAASQQAYHTSVAEFWGTCGTTLAEPTGEAPAPAPTTEGESDAEEGETATTGGAEVADDPYAEEGDDDAAEVADDADAGSAGDDE